MVLSIEELSELETDIVNYFNENITLILTRLNRLDQIGELFDLIGYEQVEKESFEFYKNGKIVVVGGTEVKEEVLSSIAKNMGIDKNRFEFCLDFKSAQKFEFNKLYYANQYRVVLFGPVPHSTKGKVDSSSIIAEIENKPGYPRVERLIAGNELKITKTSFRNCLDKLIAEDYI